MIDLSTTYLGMKLKNPIVVSSSSLCDSVEKVKGLENAGAGAVVLKSMFEEQILLEAEKLEATTSAGSHSFAEASESYFADIPIDLGPSEYLRLVEGCKKAVSIPVMASLNCISADKWGTIAKDIEGAGADALELNVYWIPTDPNRNAGQLEADYLGIVERVRKQVKIPIAVKLSPFFTSIPNMVSEVVKRGANGVVLFNRFYQPNLDIDEMKVASQLHLSRPEDALLPIRWIALLHDRVQTDFAATSGIHDGKTAMKAVLAGANVTQVCSALFKYKPAHIALMLREMEAWLKSKEYDTLAETRGILSQKTNPDPEHFERAQYVKLLVGHD